MGDESGQSAAHKALVRVRKFIESGQNALGGVGLSAAARLLRPPVAAALPTKGAPQTGPPAPTSTLGADEEEEEEVNPVIAEATEQSISSDQPVLESGGATGPPPSFQTLGPKLDRRLEAKAAAAAATAAAADTAADQEALFEQQRQKLNAEADAKHKSHRKDQLIRYIVLMVCIVTIILSLIGMAAISRRVVGKWWQGEVPNAR
jgi:hypothetical protein